MRLAHPNTHFNNKIGSTIKRTIISFAIALPLISCHINKSYGVPSRREGMAAVAKMTDERRREPGCLLKGRDAEFSVPDGRVVQYSNALKKDDRALDIACLGNRAFILTKRSLIIISAAGLGESEGNMRLNSFLSRTDMTGILGRGFAGWAQSGEACYFLTQDRKLTIMPNEEGNVSEFALPFDSKAMRKDQMIFHSGFLFISPDKGSVYVFKLSGEKGAKMIPIGVKASQPGFFIDKGSLFFGRKREEMRKIEITGSDLSDVQIR